MKFLSFSIVSSLLVLTTSASKLQTQGLGEKHIAVLIVGIEDSFAWGNALKYVISPVTKQGYAVHFYIRLVGRDKQDDGNFHPLLGEGSSPVDIDDWKQNNHINKTNTAGDSHVVFAKSGTASQVDIIYWKEVIAQTPGSQIKSFELLNESEHVQIPAKAPRRIFQYPPRESRAGRNLLRKFQSTELLMRKVMDEEKAGEFRYDFVMTTRDDATWLSPLNMDPFEKANNSQNTIFSRNCKTWGDGLNDKVFVFGREAAEKCLIGLYSDFWTSGIGAYNAEAYWMELAKNKEVQSVTVAPTELALSDTTWQKGKPCQPAFYHCEAAYETASVACVGDVD